MPKLLMLVSDEELDEVKHDFLNIIHEAMKDDFKVMMNNQSFTTRVS